MSGAGNSDLVWGLENINHRQLAIDFVMRFANKLCIYSRTVEKLYSNYDLFFPPAENHSMMIIPNQHAHHDTFNDVNEEAVIDTNFDIIPGEMIGKKGLYVRIPFEDGAILTSSRFVPFRFAIEHMTLNAAGQKPLIPILVKGNLREFEFTNPYLHLHSINLDKITKLSEFQKRDIHRTIWSKLQDVAAKLPPPSTQTSYDLTDFFGPT